MASIASALGRIKGDLPGELSALRVRAMCVALGHAWRERILDPVIRRGGLRLLMLQVLHGNTACAHLPRLSGVRFSVAAYCEARARLPLELLRRVAGAAADRLCAASQDVSRWRGHRLWHIDGTGFSMPDTPQLQAHFGQPGAQKPGCGFPVAHLLVMVHAATGLIADMIASPLRTHDLFHARELHGKLRPGDVLVGDRAFCSYAHIALVLRRNLHAVFRMHPRTIVDFTPGRAHGGVGKGRRKGLPVSRWLAALGVTDQLVEWARPAARPVWMGEAEFASLPESMAVRELRYRVGRPGFRVEQVTLVTTLLDAQTHPAAEVAEVYGGRWAVETNLRHLKSTMKMDVLRCKSADGVMKELWTFALVYNLVRGVMLEAAVRQGVPPGRISFIDALRWMCAEPAEVSATLLVNPDRARRPGRNQPRVLKRRKARYPYMTHPRDELRQRLLSASSAVTC